MAIRDLALQLDTCSGGIILKTSSDKGVQLHPVWLRERVIDPNNFDGQTRQRLYEPTDIDDDICIKFAAIKYPDTIELKFNDGLHSFVSLSQIIRELEWADDHEATPRPIIWTSNFQDWPRADWADTNTPQKLKSILQWYYTYGFCLLSNTPTEPDSLLTLARVFGHIRTTNFGTLFDVETKLEPTDLADTNRALPAHTDNPYRRPIPGIQFLHCLYNNVNGGLGTLVDGFAIVEELRRRNPEMVEVLSTVHVRFRYESSTTILQSHGPHIELDKTGKTKCVRLSSRVDYVPPLDCDTLSRYYAARKIMHRMANDPIYQINFNYEPGLLLMMDNSRLLHGRTAYDNEQGHRLLQGCYIDHDGPNSLYRELSKQLSRLPVDQEGE